MEALVTTNNPAALGEPAFKMRAKGPRPIPRVASTMQIATTARLVPKTCAQKDAAPSGGDDALLAPMPGVVVDVAVTVGAEVEAGALLLTIESMKLQTAIVAPTAGRVVELGLSAGSSFEQGAVLVRLEGLDTEEGESQ